MNLSILNSICYTIGWFWCVHFGVSHQPLIASMGALFLIVFQLYYTRTKNIGLYIQDLLLLVFSISLGFFLEIFFNLTNVIHYVHSNTVLPPPWIVFLYGLFSLVINHSLRIIKKSKLLAFLFGFLGAPLTYIGGASLGGVTFSYPISFTWIIIGFIWGLFLCFLTKIANMIEKATIETLAERDSELTFTLLYDRECPICKQEICILQKRGHQGKIEFVDVSSSNYSPIKFHNIDYQTAMSQIHAIDGNGNVIVGVPVFADLYARSKLLIISTLFRIPFIKSCLKPLYKLFVKNRLWVTGRTLKLK